MCSAHALTGREQGRPEFEVADIIRAHGQAYRQSHVLSPEQHQALRDLGVCRTAVLGGHVDLCQECGFERPSYNSCRNRHCPKCQSLNQARWIAARQERTLPVHHFHLVFTLPAELRALVYQNQSQLYPLLFKAATSTLLELGADPKHLGAQLGVSAILHTWTRELSYHPHLHCIVTGGGLSKDGKTWLSTKPGFLFPVRVLSKLFRSKFIAGLDALVRSNKLKFEGECAELEILTLYRAFIDKLYCKNFNVFSEPPFGGPEHLLQYLGRYTHRVALSNQRIISIDDAGVCFVTKDENTLRLKVEEFLRRFLLHILPKGFVKIRHFGLMASANVNTKLCLARTLLEAKTSSKPKQISEKPAKPKLAEQPWESQLEQLCGIDLRSCPRCKKGRLLRLVVAQQKSSHQGRSPP